MKDKLAVSQIKREEKKCCRKSSKGQRPRWINLTWDIKNKGDKSRRRVEGERWVR